MKAPSDDPSFDASLVKFVESHPGAATIASSPTAVMIREVYAIPREIAKINVSDGLLRGPTLLRTAPYLIVDNARKTVFAAFSLGNDLSGYPGNAHGGLVAMLLDEVMGKAGLSVLGDSIAYTAKLEVDYLAPISVNDYAVVIANVESVTGRKVWITAVVEGSKPGSVCARARMLVIRIVDTKL